MWASVVEHLTTQGCLGKTLQVRTGSIPAVEHSEHCFLLCSSAVQLSGCTAAACMIHVQQLMFNALKVRTRAGLCQPGSGCQSAESLCPVGCTPITTFAATLLPCCLQVCCQRHSKITDITHPREFDQLVGDGGCQQACGLKLPCGHTCPRRCHADDPRHSQVRR
jgi:hypothetical protein